MLPTVTFAANPLPEFRKVYCFPGGTVTGLAGLLVSVATKGMDLPQSCETRMELHGTVVTIVNRWGSGTSGLAVNVNAASIEIPPFSTAAGATGSRGQTLTDG